MSPCETRKKNSYITQGGFCGEFLRRARELSSFVSIGHGFVQMLRQGYAAAALFEARYSSIVSLSSLNLNGFRRKPVAPALDARASRNWSTQPLMSSTGTVMP